MLLTACMLGGCTNRAQVASEQERVMLPEPSAQPQQMILGDTAATEPTDVTLYYAEGNSSTLTGMTRTIRVGSNENLAEKAVLELLHSSMGNSLRITSTDTQLLGIENSRGIVTVNLSIDAGARQSDRDYLYLCAAIGNTLLSLEDVEGVNILIGGRSDALRGLPVGTITENIDQITAAYAQYEAENSQFIHGSAGSIERSITLYFPSKNGKFMLPEIRKLQFESTDYASYIINALKAGAESASSFSPIAANLELFTEWPELHITDSGLRVLELNLSPLLPNYLAFSGIEAWQLYGSIVLSMTGFIPELDAVRIFIDGEPVQNCRMGYENILVKDGMFRREDFAHRIGSVATMYFETNDGCLARSEQALSRADSVSARHILAGMISAEVTEGLRSVFPEGVYSEDILGVSLRSNVAVLNLSGNFYSKCQQLSAQQERNLVYAMVNTLCELDQIGAVRILVEGRSIETLAGSIYLKSTLMPNPGLVHSDTES